MTCVFHSFELGYLTSYNILLIVVPRNLFNSFKLLIGILQYGSPGSPTINFEIQKISTLNIATPPPPPHSLRPQPPLWDFQRMVKTSL